MNFYLQQAFDWLEVWALLIPLIFMLRQKQSPSYMKPVRYYIYAALVLNLLILVIWKRNKLGITLPDWLTSNNFVYNFHSIVRFFLFSWFFNLLNQRFMHRVKALLPYLFGLFILINFIFFEDFFNYWSFSSLLLAAEAALLLFYCLQYFIYIIIEEREVRFRKRPDFWVVTGLSIYVAVCFTVFLFFKYLTEHYKEFAVLIWDAHNIAFLVLCIFIARAFYDRHN